MSAPDDDASESPASRDPIEAVREELVSLDGIPVVDRVARLEQANAVLATALAELDEV